MPYALLLVGAVMLVAGVRNTYGVKQPDGSPGLWGLVEGDFRSGFFTWIAAIAVVGGLGYIPKLKPLSVAFMTLLLLVLVISNGGVFAKLQQFIQSGTPGGGTAPVPVKTGQLQPLTPLDQINQNLQGIG